MALCPWIMQLFEIKVRLTKNSHMDLLQKLEKWKKDESPASTLTDVRALQWERFPSYLPVAGSIDVALSCHTNTTEDRGSLN